MIRHAHLAVLISVTFMSVPGLSAAPPEKTAAAATKGSPKAARANADVVDADLATCDGPTTAPESVDAPSQPAPSSASPQYPPGVRPGGLTLGEAVRIGGYGSARFETNSLGGPKAAGFDFRRFVLTADATMHDRIRAYLELEFERLGELEVERRARRRAGGVRFVEAIEGGNGGEISIEQMWGEFKFGSPLSVRIGAVLPPLGRFNINHDDDRWNIPRRSLVDRNAPVLPVHAAWTELGAGINGGVDVGATGRVSYQAYVVNGATLDFTIEKAAQSRPDTSETLGLAAEVGLTRGSVAGEGGARAGTWRVAYSPTIASEVGISGYHGRYTPDFLPEVHERINAFGIDGLVQHGGLALEGEFLHSDFGNTTRVADAFVRAITGPAGLLPPPSAPGTVTEFTLVGLTPSRHGFWVEARYRFWPSRLSQTSLGRGFQNPQLVPVVRYERVTLRDAIDEVAITAAEVEAGERETLRQDRLTVGLSYRPLPTVAFSVAVEHNRRLEGGSLVFPRGGVQASSYTTLIAGMALGF